MLQLDRWDAFEVPVCQLDRLLAFAMPICLLQLDVTLACIPSIFPAAARQHACLYNVCLSAVAGQDGCLSPGSSRDGSEDC